MLSVFRSNMSFSPELSQEKAFTSSTKKTIIHHGFSIYENEPNIHSHTAAVSSSIVVPSQSLSLSPLPSFKKKRKEKGGFKPKYSAMLSLCCLSLSSHGFFSMYVCVKKGLGTATVYVEAFHALC